jgi:hypothetical protein
MLARTTEFEVDRQIRANRPVGLQPERPSLGHAPTATELYARQGEEKRREEKRREEKRREGRRMNCLRDGTTYRGGG